MYGKFSWSRISSNYKNKRICVLIIIKKLFQCFKPYSAEFAINWIFHTKSPLKFRKSRIISKTKTNLMKTQRSTLLNTETIKSSSKNFNIIGVSIAFIEEWRVFFGRPNLFKIKRFLMVLSAQKLMEILNFVLNSVEIVKCWRIKPKIMEFKW